MKIAFIGGLSGIGIFPDEFITPRYRKAAHPAPWIDGLLPELARQTDFKLRFFVVHRAIAKSCLVERNGVEYVGVPSPVLERFAPHTLLYSKSLALRASMRRFSPDLIHAFGLETGAATLALRQGFPVSCFVQGIVELLYPYYGQRSFLQKQVALRTERNAVKRIRWMVAETNFARDWVLKHNPEAYISLIPHPLRKEFLEVGNRLLTKRIVSVGGLDARKGMDTVIRAFAKVHDQESRLTIVGSGPSEEVLKKLANNLGVGNRVDFTGFLNIAGVIKEISKGAVYAIASRMDTSPNVVTEAHAVGLPVIGTRAGGIPEMIDEGVDGYCVDVDDEVAMSARMNELLADPEKAWHMGEAGREKVRMLNDPERIAQDHVEFFERIRSDLKHSS